VVIVKNDGNADNYDDDNDDDSCDDVLQVNKNEVYILSGEV
jgi:hypothetical protein